MERPAGRPKTTPAASKKPGAAARGDPGDVPPPPPRSASVRPGGPQQLSKKVRDVTNRLSAVPKCKERRRGGGGSAPLPPHPRNAMGEYVPQKDRPPLSAMAFPTPGPLDYNAALPPAGQHYSILGKHADGKHDGGIGPGPAKYNVRSEHGQGAGFSIARRLPRRELKIGADSPGPAVYNVAWAGVGTESTSAVVSVRHPEPESQVPGPDKYTIPSPLGNPPAYTMGHRMEKTPDNNPGPADYDVEVPIPTPPAYTLGARRGEAFDLKEAALVPPADRYFPVPEQSRLAASLKGRAKETKPPETPGPATYLISPIVPEGPQYTQVGRNVPREDEPYYTPPPGPDTYNPKDDLTTRRVPEFRMHSPPRRKIPEKPAAPGPGSYQPEGHTVKRNTSQKVMLKGKRREPVDQTPGPGSYNIPSEMGNQTWPPKVLFPTQRQRRPSSSASQPPPPGRPGALAGVPPRTPGPADYAVITKFHGVGHTGPAPTLGARPRERDPERTPGPNQYGGAAEGPNARGRIGPSMKGRLSPYVTIFPTSRLAAFKA